MPVKPEPPIPPQPNVLATRLLGLWQPFAWGLAATVAATAAILVSQTETGAERLELAFSSTPPQSQAVAPLPQRVVVDTEETRRLAEAIRTLAADRDRLKERIANLERNLDDMTGSIKSVMQANAALQSVKEPPKERIAAPPPTVSAPAVAPAVVAAPPPVSAPPATAIATPEHAPTPPAPAPEKIAKPGPPPPGAEPMQTDAVPLPPVSPLRVAALPQAAEAPAKVEYGIDLGGAASLDIARNEWSRVKANFGPLLGGLRPLASPRTHQTGTDYRLIVGPFPTVAAAAKICAKFNTAKAACRAAKFTGEELTQR